MVHGNLLNDGAMIYVRRKKCDAYDPSCTLFDIQVNLPSGNCMQALKTCKKMHVTLALSGFLWYNSLCDIRAVRCQLYFCAGMNVYEERSYKHE